MKTFNIKLSDDELELFEKHTGFKCSQSNLSQWIIINLRKLKEEK